MRLPGFAEAVAGGGVFVEGHFGGGGCLGWGGGLVDGGLVDNEAVGER